MKAASVLLVDDHPTFLKLARAFLESEKWGGQIISTSNPLEALPLARSLRPDVVLVDLVMPGMNGLDLIRLLREELPGAGIVAMSMLDASLYEEAAVSSGADAFVFKPSMNVDLIPTIYSILAKKRPAGDRPDAT